MRDSLRVYLPSLSDLLSDGTSRSSSPEIDEEEGFNLEVTPAAEPAETLGLTLARAVRPLQQPAYCIAQQSCLPSKTAVTPTSILSIENGSSSATSQLDNSSLDTVKGCQDAELKAHALYSFGSDIFDDDCSTANPTCQECRSHAINVQSDECSLMTTTLKLEEVQVPWTDKLIMCSKPIGKGTFGTVFEARLATDASETYPLAIKKVTCHTQREYNFIKHEASLMQGMSQAGLESVPQLYDFHWIREEDAAYLVMQRIRGMTLEEFIDKQKLQKGVAAALDKAVVQQHIAALVQAVHELHSNGFVHADLKNSNAIATLMGGSVAINLVDMACSQHQKAGQRKVRGGGTLHHMAPELVGNYMRKAAGKATVPQDGFPCDIWALGVMLFELLTGNLPFWPKTGFDYDGMQKLLANWALALEGRLISRKLQQLQRISISAADLVVKMLKIKPAQRITAPEAVRHEYILGDAL